MDCFGGPLFYPPTSLLGHISQCHRLEESLMLQGLQLWRSLCCPTMGLAPLGPCPAILDGEIVCHSSSWNKRTSYPERTTELQSLIGQSAFIDTVVTEPLLCASMRFIQLRSFVFDYENFVDRRTFNSIFWSLRISELVGSLQVPAATPLPFASAPADSSSLCFSDEKAELGVGVPSKLLCDLSQVLSLSGCRVHPVSISCGEHFLFVSRQSLTLMKFTTCHSNLFSPTSRYGRFLPQPRDIRHFSPWHFSKLFSLFLPPPLPLPLPLSISFYLILPSSLLPPLPLFQR